jgi:hypothetical protein
MIVSSAREWNRLYVGDIGVSGLIIKFRLINSLCRATTVELVSAYIYALLYRIHDILNSSNNFELHKFWDPSTLKPRSAL